VSGQIARTLELLVAANHRALVGSEVLSDPRSLPFDGLLTIQGPWLALGTGMCKIGPESVFHIVWVVTLDVLPCLTRLAEYGVSVIVSEVAYALDCVCLFFHSLLRQSV
jgi:hypothetical protein